MEQRGLTRDLSTLLRFQGGEETMDTKIALFILLASLTLVGCPVAGGVKVASNENNCNGKEILGCFHDKEFKFCSPETEPYGGNTLGRTKRQMIWSVSPWDTCDAHTSQTLERIELWASIVTDMKPNQICIVRIWRDGNQVLRECR